MSLVKKLKKLIEFIIFQRTFSSKFVFYTSEKEGELEEIYKIRYEVYCLERQYLDKNNYPDCKERDIWDKQSVHFVLRNIITNELAASVRLIFDSKYGFPIEKNFQLEFTFDNRKRNEFAEISRLIVARKYRKQFLLLALVRGMYLYVQSKGIKHAFCVLDDSLHPILKKIGFPFKQIGKPSAYQGITTPYVLDLEEMKEYLNRHNPQLRKWLTRGTVEDNGYERSFTIH